MKRTWRTRFVTSRRANSVRARSASKAKDALPDEAISSRREKCHLRIAPPLACAAGSGRYRNSMSETLAGIVEHVTFHNAENGFVVFRARVNDRPVTIVGQTPRVVPGERIEAVGVWKVDPDHGDQFHAESLTSRPPLTREGIERFLGSGLIKGIGPAYAKKIVQVFGEKTLKIIDESPTFLREIKGIGPCAASRRSARVGGSRRRSASWRSSSRPMAWGPPGPSASTRRVWRQGAVDKVRENPYCLAADIWGIGFATADDLARKHGSAGRLAGTGPCRPPAHARHQHRRGALRLSGDRPPCPHPRTDRHRRRHPSRRSRGSRPGGGSCPRDGDDAGTVDLSDPAPSGGDGDRRRTRRTYEGAASAAGARRREGARLGRVEDEGRTRRRAARGDPASGHAEGARHHRRARRRQDDAGARHPRRLPGKESPLLAGSSDRPGGATAERKHRPAGADDPPAARVRRPRATAHPQQAARLRSARHR